ncbi:MAG TPA: pseudouridine synthase [Candidatus Saccharibacteria bacterium]|nr:pseudouridine synthase [Candidatus Saccharibacteria bacterium]
MRINKFLSLSLRVSRRRADTLIEEGVITINDLTASKGLDVFTNDLVKYGNLVLELPQKFYYVSLNKPVGFVCSRRGQGNRTIFELLPKNLQSLKNVGRLDKNSSGIIVLTNDGDFHHQLTHPKYHKQKTYLVKLNKPISRDSLELINKQGVRLEDGLSKFRVRQNKDLLIVDIYEGRNRQIRRTFKALGYVVTALHRTRFGPYKLNDLGPGEYRFDTKRT